MNVSRPAVRSPGGPPSPAFRLREETGGDAFRMHLSATVPRGLPFAAPASPGALARAAAGLPAVAAPVPPGMLPSALGCQSCEALRDRLAAAAGERSWLESQLAASKAECARLQNIGAFQPDGSELARLSDLVADLTRENTSLAYQLEAEKARAPGVSARSMMPGLRDADAELLKCATRACEDLQRKEAEWADEWASREERLQGEAGRAVAELAERNAGLQERLAGGAPAEARLRLGNESLQRALDAQVALTDNANSRTAALMTEVDALRAHVAALTDGAAAQARYKTACESEIDVLKRSLADPATPQPALHRADHLAGDLHRCILTLQRALCSPNPQGHIPHDLLHSILADMTRCRDEIHAAGVDAPAATPPTLHRLFSPSIPAADPVHLSPRCGYAPFVRAAPPPVHHPAAVAVPVSLEDELNRCFTEIVQLRSQLRAAQGGGGGGASPVRAPGAGFRSPGELLAEIDACCAEIGSLRAQLRACAEQPRAAERRLAADLESALADNAQLRAALELGVPAAGQAELVRGLEAELHGAHAANASLAGKLHALTAAGAGSRARDDEVALLRAQLSDALAEIAVLGMDLGSRRPFTPRAEDATPPPPAASSPGDFEMASRRSPSSRTGQQPRPDGTDEKNAALRGANEELQRRVGDLQKELAECAEKLEEAERHGDARDLVARFDVERREYEAASQSTVGRVKDVAAREKERLEDKLASLERMLRDAKDEVAGLRTRNDASVESLRASFVAERRILQERVSASQAEADENATRAHRLEADVSRLTIEAAAAREEAARYQALHAKTAEHLEEERAGNRASLLEKLQEISSLKIKAQEANETAEDLRLKLQQGRMEMEERLGESHAAAAELKRSLAKAAAKLEQAEGDAAKLRRTVAELQREAAEAERAHAEAVQRLRAQFEAQAADRDAKRASDAVIDELTTALEAAEAALRSAKQQLDDERDAHAAAKRHAKSWQDTVDALTADNAKLKATHRDLQAALGDADAAAEAAAAAARARDLERAALHQQGLAAAQAQVKAKQADLAAVEARLRQALQELAAAAEQRDDLQRALDARAAGGRAELASLEGQLRAEKQQVASLKAQLAELQAEVAAEQASSRDALAELDDLRSGRDGWRLEKSRGEAQLKARQAELAALKEALDRAEAQKGDLAGRLAASQGEADQLQLAKARLEAQLKAKAAELAAKEDRIQRLKASIGDLNDAGDTCEHLREAKRKLEAEVDTVRRALADAQRALQRAAAEREADQSAAESLQRRVDELDAALEKERKALAVESKLNKELQALVREAQESQARLQKELADALEQQDGHKRTASALQRDQDKLLAATDRVRQLESERDDAGRALRDAQDRFDADLARRLMDERARLHALENEYNEKMELYRQRDDALKRLEAELAAQKQEQEFVLFTRAELVQAIMELRRVLKEAAKEAHRYFTRDAAFKKALHGAGTGVARVSGPFLAEATAKVKAAADDAKERVNLIVARYVTDYEQRHNGASPQRLISLAEARSRSPRGQPASPPSGASRNPFKLPEPLLGQAAAKRASFDDTLASSISDMAGGILYPPPDAARRGQLQQQLLQRRDGDSDKESGASPLSPQKRQPASSRSHTERPPQTRSRTPGYGDAERKLRNEPSDSSLSGSSRKHSLADKPDWR